MGERESQLARWKILFLPPVHAYTQNDRDREKHDQIKRTMCLPRKGIMSLFPSLPMKTRRSIGNTYVLQTEALGMASHCSREEILVWFTEPHVTWPLPTRLASVSSPQLPDVSYIPAIRNFLHILLPWLYCLPGTCFTFSLATSLTSFRYLLCHFLQEASPGLWVGFSSYACLLRHLIFCIVIAHVVTSAETVGSRGK